MRGTHTHTHTHLTLLLYHHFIHGPLSSLLPAHLKPPALISQKMQPIHWSFLFYGLSSDWKRRKVKLSNIFNQEIIKWWWINWTSASLCVCVWGVRQIQSLLVFRCFHALNVMFFIWVLHNRRSDLCAVVLQSLTAACILAINLSVCFYYSVVWMCVREWVGGVLYSLCTFFFFLSFELFSLNWINPVGQSEIFVCGNCLTAVSCTQDPQH